MEIHKDNRCLLLKLFCQLPAAPERAVYAAHVLSPLQVHYSKLYPMLLHNAAAMSRHSGREVCRAQYSLFLVQIWVDFSLLPNMVAGGYDIGAALEELVCCSRENAETFG